MSRFKLDLNVTILIVFLAFLMLDFGLGKTGDEKSKETKPKDEKSDAKPDWTEKNILEYNDADIERLYEQWEKGDEPLEDDELPEYLRKPPKLDLTAFDLKDPESLLKMSKKGKTLMTFVSVSGNPTTEELEELTKLWQSSLMNNHIQADRFIVDENRAIFMFKDGSQAWEAKDFLVEQERCQEVVIENKNYLGKYANKKETNKEHAEKREPRQEL